MSSSTNGSFRSLEGVQKAFLIGLGIWIFLQLSRAIAMVLINDINAGGSPEAWRYPAYLDLFATVFALPLVWAIWARRGFLTWVATVVYLAISIVDHVGNFVTTSFVGPPSIAEDMSNPLLIPFIQNAIDIVFFVLLFVPKIRELFFRIK